MKSMVADDARCSELAAATLTVVVQDRDLIAAKDALDIVESGRRVGKLEEGYTLKRR